MQNCAGIKIMQLYQTKGYPCSEYYSWVCMKWRGFETGNKNNQSRGDVDKVEGSGRMPLCERRAFCDISGFLLSYSPYESRRGHPVERKGNLSYPADNKPLTLTARS